MAEQELADNTEAMAAVMAAAEVAGDIDMMTSERRNNADQASSTDRQPADIGTAGADSAGEVATTYLDGEGTARHFPRKIASPSSRGYYCRH